MKFNGYDFSPYLDANMTRPIMPTITIETEKVSGKAGALFRNRHVEPLSIPVRIRLKALPSDDIAELRHILAEALLTEEPAELVLDDDPTRSHMAIFRGSSELSNLWYTATADVEFYCPDPIAYGRKDSADVENGVFRVGGSWPTSPIITCKPKAGSYHRITNYSTGEYIQITRTFTGTETVIYDCQKQKATVNGVNAAIVLASDYFELSPGQNTLVRSNGTAIVEWTERWL